MKEDKEDSLLDKDQVQHQVCLFDLPGDILQLVVQNLSTVGFLKFRAIGKTCSRLVPSINRRKNSRVREKKDEFLSPWLMHSQNDRARYHFIDPVFGDVYLMNIPKILIGAQIRYSKDGWVLLSKSDRGTFLFFYNPFTKKIVSLPEAPQGYAMHDNFCFTTDPSSPDCVVLGVDDTTIVWIDMMSQEWSVEDFLEFENIPRDDYSEVLSAKHSSPVYYGGAFYLLVGEGYLQMIRFDDGLSDVMILDETQGPCDDGFNLNFLLEWDGKLTSVFVGFNLEWLRIFTLNEALRVWEQVTNLGKNSFFLSRYSAFSTRAKVPEMENKIYFPNTSGRDNNNILFYCLTTRKSGCMENEQVEECVSSSCWVEQSWR